MIARIVAVAVASFSMLVNFAFIASTRSVLSDRRRRVVIYAIAHGKR
jgi:hypothetical protein